MRTKQIKPISARERILKAAKHLFQRRGYFAVSTADILAAAKAPKGSMYHHFPGGKEQIAIEAVHTISKDVIEMMTKLETAKQPVGAMVRTLAKGMARWLKASEWREGTLLISATVGSIPEMPKLHAAIRQAFDAWRNYMIALLVREGWPKLKAVSMAHTLIAGIEGAMILARVDQDERVVIRVADTLATLVESSKQ